MYKLKKKSFYREKYIDIIFKYNLKQDIWHIIAAIWH